MNRDDQISEEEEELEAQSPDAMEEEEASDHGRSKSKAKPEYSESDEDEEDDEEENPEEMQGFIVGDDEVEEDEEDVPGYRGIEEEPREKKKKKKHRIRKEIEPDEDDLELIQENEGLERTRKKLKKVKEIARGEEDYMREPSVEGQNENDFIEEEEDDMGEERERERRPMKRGEGFNVLSMIFGEGYEQEVDEEYPEEEKREEDDDLPPEEKAAKLRKKYEKMFDPAELQDKFVSVDDEQIIADDMPERFQFRFKNRLPDNNEIVQETNWIADKMIVSKGVMDKNTENFRKNIMKVLEFLRIHFYEIMYIHTYKANEISLKPGELKLQDLWRIYDLDIEWTGIWSRRKLLEKTIDQMSSFIVFPELVMQLFNTSYDKFGLDNLQKYCDYQTQMNPDHSQSQSNEMQIEGSKQVFKKAKREVIKQEFKLRFDDFVSKFLLSTDKFADNLFSGIPKHSPPAVDDLLIDITQKYYVDESISKLSNSQSFLNRLSSYVANDLFHDPIIRKVVYKQYFDKLLLSTEPTAKGKKEIDMYNINYCVKRIDGRPLKDLEEDIWLRAVQNEKEGRITIKLHFRWKDPNMDEIIIYLKNMYLYDSKIKNEANSQWNILRTEIISNLMKNHMYPFLETVVRKDLTENAEKKIAQECGKKYKEMINAAPYKKQDGDNVINEIRVMSLIPDEGNKVTCAIVDKYGGFMEHKTYNYLLVSERAPIEYITKQTIEEEDLKKVVERYMPDLLVVGADNLSAKSLVKYLRGQSQKWNEDVGRVWIKYGDMTAPKIYAKMAVSNSELQNYPLKLKEAMSLARLQQSPLHEILKLWHHRKEENGSLYIVFHDLQEFVSPDKLIQEFEKAAMEVTNQVGIDINKVLAHPHLSHPFQFIAGLGPRKAKSILDTVSQKMSRINSRKEFLEDKIVAKNVFTNMCGFIKVLNEDNTEQRDLLDTTRIHINDYKLAQKIAKDALDDVEHGADPIKTIIEKPQKLDELDLDDYAAHLESKGKQNMKIPLDFIVKELTDPFADPREAHKEMDHKELFYKMTKMHPFDLQNGSLVNARITKVTEKNIICRLECGIEGNVFVQDVFEGKEATQSLTQKYHEGQIVTTRVGSSNFDEKSKRKDDDREGKTIDFTKLHLYLKSSIVSNHERFLKDLHPSTAQTFRVIPEEDFPVTQQTTAKQVKYYTRKINHPKFKNASAQVALNYLEDKEIGDYMVRPSSKGMDRLTLTWKFYTNIYVHLDIKESGKGPGDKIGRRLLLKDQVYESIDELAAGYINPCNSFVKNILQNNKFLNDQPSRIEEIIKQEKEEKPKLIPYRFGFSVEAPQYLVLYYAPKDYNIVKEYIKVKPNGLHFHNNVFQNVSQLVTWFKQNYHKPEYHKYLKHVKPPVALPKAAVPVKSELSSYAQGASTPTHLSRAFEVKKEKGFAVKQEKGVGMGMKEEYSGGYQNRGGDDRGGDRDRGGFRQGRGGRPFGDQDRNRFQQGGQGRDNNRFQRNRSERSRSRSRDKERDRERPKDFGRRDYQQGGYDRGDRGGDRGGRRDFGDRRRDSRDGGRDYDRGVKREADWGAGKESTGGWSNKGSDGWGAGKSSVGDDGGWGSKASDAGSGGWGSKPAADAWGSKPAEGGWGSNAMVEERRPNEGGWGDENRTANSQGINVKTEWKASQDPQ